jgi:hypothetical protein
MGSPLLVAALVVIVGLVAAGVAIMRQGDEAEQALERDEHDVSSGRGAGPALRW